MDTTPTCGHPARPQSGYCGDRAEWMIACDGWDVDVPMCGLHSMRFKEPDGFTRRDLHNEPETGETP